MLVHGMGIKKRNFDIRPLASIAEIERDEALLLPATGVHLLFGSTRRRLLALLFGQPDREFQGRELLEIGGSGVGATVRELRAMERAGLVCSRWERHRRFYRAARNTEIHFALVDLVRNSFGLVQPLREAFAVVHGIELAFVYEAPDKGRGRRPALELLLASNGASDEAIDFAIESARHRLYRDLRVLHVEPVELKAPREFIAKVLASPRTWVFGDERRLRAMTSGP
jgi:hypothetical protein